MAVYLGNSQVGFNYVPSVAGTTNIEVVPLEITSNGTYTATAGSAYSPVTVNTVPEIKMGVLRADATLLKSVKQDYLLLTSNKITNESYTSSLPTYSTSTITLRTGSDVVLDTISLNITNYNYYVLLRTLTTPIYNINTKAKGRAEYHLSEYMYELIQTDANLFKALLDNTLSTGTIAALTACGSCARLVYWNSATALNLYSTTGYGTYQTVNAPTYSSGTLTIKDTNVGIRGSATYLASTYYNAITDIRVQTVIDVYQAPKTATTKGWSNTSSLYHIANCISSNGTLT